MLSTGIRDTLLERHNRQISNVNGDNRATDMETSDKYFNIQSVDVTVNGNKRTLPEDNEDVKRNKFSNIDKEKITTDPGPLENFLQKSRIKQHRDGRNTAIEEHLRDISAPSRPRH